MMSYRIFYHFNLKKISVLPPRFPNPYNHSSNGKLNKASPGPEVILITTASPSTAQNDSKRAAASPGYPEQCLTWLGQLIQTTEAKQSCYQSISAWLLQKSGTQVTPVSCKNTKP